MLAYYSPKDYLEYVVVYERSEGGIVDFVEGLTVEITQGKLGEHSVYLTEKNVLFISDIGSSTTDAKITRYDVSTKYNIILSYDTPGTFNTIKLTTANHYSSSSTDIKVDFAKNDDGDDSGVKWYTIMIIAFIVVLIIGVAYGMYLKMVKRRKDKTISLLTEGEEVDEEIWERTKENEPCDLKSFIFRSCFWQKDTWILSWHEIYLSVL